MIEGVLKREAALNLVCLDHRRQHLPHGERGLWVGAGKPIGNGKNAAQVVRGVAPLGGKPGVVEVEPANHGADVERSLNRV